LVPVCSATVFVRDCNHLLPDNTTCPAGKGPYIYPDPDHCSRFWQCDNGCSSHMLCQKDFLYDVEHKWCNTPELVECGSRDCDGRPCKKPAPKPEFECPTPNGLFPDEANCMKYFQCYENVPQVMNCQVTAGQQLLYDPAHEWCNWPDSVDCGLRPICDKNDENCNNQPTLPPTTTAPPNLCDEFGSCSLSDNGALRPQGVCDHCFCECSSGRWQQLCCQPNLIFDGRNLQCNWPYNVPGCN